MSARVFAALLLVLLSPAAAPLVGAEPSVAAEQPLYTPAPAQQLQVTETPPPAENTTFFLQVRPNGDARWTITDTYALPDENATRAFEELGAAFAAGETTQGWVQTFRAASAAASQATGREMNVTDVSRDYVVRDDRGTLVLEFTWTNFATVSGNRVVVGDAFNTTEGTWFGRLTEGQQLVISPPRGYGVRSVPTAVDDGKLRFEGPRTFEPGYLQIVYAGDATTQSTDETPAEPFPGSSLWLGGAAVLILALAGVVGYMARYGAIDPGAPSASSEAGSTGTPAAPGGDGSANEAGAEESDVDLALLSDEERVERLLEENGGRMKQARIVKETGWSNAKVSQLLSSMDDADRIDKLRIGRENLISFPDEEIGDFEE